MTFKYLIPLSGLFWSSFLKDVAILIILLPSDPIQCYSILYINLIVLNLIKIIPFFVKFWTFFANYKFILIWIKKRMDRLLQCVLTNWFLINHRLKEEQNKRINVKEGTKENTNEIEEISII